MVWHQFLLPTLLGPMVAHAYNWSTQEDCEFKNSLNNKASPQSLSYRVSKTPHLKYKASQASLPPCVDVCASMDVCLLVPAHYSTCAAIVTRA